MNDWTSMTMGLLLTVALVATVVRADEPVAVRRIPIPAREHGYSNFETTVIGSQAALDQFLKGDQQGGDMGWNNRQEFIEALDRANLDFEKEQLVLLRHTEGSGSVRVEFHPPRVEGQTVICRISRTVPEMGTADMAFYCFALAVTKTGPTEVQLTVDGRAPVTVPLKQ